MENPYRFSTKEYSPASGLLYFGARYYDPRNGRFITMDPFGMIDGPNMYAYVKNNPVNFLDWQGTLALEPWGPNWGSLLRNDAGLSVIKPDKGKKPERKYRHDKPPSRPHRDKNTGKKEPEHWHYQDHNWDPNTGKWRPGKWKYGGPGAPPS